MVAVVTLYFARRRGAVFARVFFTLWQIHCFEILVQENINFPARGHLHGTYITRPSRRFSMIGPRRFSDCDPSAIVSLLRIGENYALTYSTFSTRVARIERERKLVMGRIVRILSVISSVLGMRAYGFEAGRITSSVYPKSLQPLKRNRSLAPTFCGLWGGRQKPRVLARHRRMSRLSWTIEPSLNASAACPHSLADRSSCASVYGKTIFELLRENGAVCRRVYTLARRHLSALFG